MDIKIIHDYVLYLIGECALSVTLHPMSDESLITDSALHDFNIHSSPYCSFIKSLPGGHVRCLSQQKKAHCRCCGEGQSFCGACYAGVREYVYPFGDGKNIIGFISVSGYAVPSPERHISAVAEVFGCEREIVAKEYRTLRTQMPDKEKIDTLILPLCKMLELAYLREENTNAPSSLNERICHYIRRHYSLELTADLICEKFLCSKSYLSHTFKKHTGKSFREYLTDIRLHYARQLLEHSTLSVTQISFSVGFNDSNYFSGVFKQKEGVSPLKYRKDLLARQKAIAREK